MAFAHPNRPQFAPDNDAVHDGPADLERFGHLRHGQEVPSPAPNQCQPRLGSKLLALPVGGVVAGHLVAGCLASEPPPKSRAGDQLGASDVWAVGDFGSILHWDGTAA
jgi:hypothetical protein